MLILSANDKAVSVCYQILESIKFIGGTKNYCNDYVSLACIWRRCWWWCFRICDGSSLL